RYELRCSFLPERPNPAASFHNLTQLPGRRVAGQDVERLARRRSGQRRIEGRGQTWYQLDPVLADASVLVAHGDFLRLGPAGDHPGDQGSDLLQVDVPEPGEVLAVDHRVALGRQDGLGSRTLQDGTQGGVVGDRGLDEAEHDLAIAGRDRLQPS